MAIAGGVAHERVMSQGGVYRYTRRDGGRSWAVVCPTSGTPPVAMRMAATPVSERVAPAPASVWEDQRRTARACGPRGAVVGGSGAACSGVAPKTTTTTTSGSSILISRMYYNHGHARSFGGGLRV